jgi:hypothetical protein
VEDTYNHDDHEDRDKQSYSKHRKQNAYYPAPHGDYEPLPTVPLYSSYEVTAQLGVEPAAGKETATGDLTTEDFRFWSK